MRYEPSPPPDMSVVTYLVPFQLPVILLSIQSPTHPGFSSKEHSWHGSPASPPLLSMSTLINLSQIKLPTEFWIRPEPRDTTDSPSQSVSIARLHIRNGVSSTVLTTKEPHRRHRPVWPASFGNDVTPLQSYSRTAIPYSCTTDYLLSHLWSFV